MKTKPLTRFELLTELAAYANPTWYHSLTEWPTYKLVQLLAYYKGESTEIPDGKLRRSKGLGDEPNPRAPRLVMGIDLALGVADERLFEGMAVVGHMHPDGTMHFMNVLPIRTPRGPVLIRKAPSPRLAEWLGRGKR